MRTEELIETLAKDAKLPRESVGAWLRKAIVPGIAVAAALFVLFVGPREDAAHAITTVWYPLKLGIVLFAAILAFPVVEALARPGAPVPVGGLLAVMACLCVASLADLAVLGVSGAHTRMIGQNALHCVTVIPMLAAAPLAMAVSALRWGAPTKPALAGFAAGIFSGAVGGALYAIHCPDDSPLFVAVWYVIAILIVSLAGAFAGKLALRW